MVFSWESLLVVGLGGGILAFTGAFGWIYEAWTIVPLFKSGPLSCVLVVVRNKDRHKKRSKNSLNLNCSKSYSFLPSIGSKKYS
jgi:hypothetical protein